MALASASVLVVEELPKMAAASIFFPWVSPNFLLPLREALQDQQVGLPQAPFKMLLLPWVSECVRVCVSPLRKESVFSTVLWLS